MAPLSLKNRSMASDAKTGGLACEDATDRISNLPKDLIFLILKRLPVHDAVRTSILSKKWGSIWAMHPRLQFDDTFFSRLASTKVMKKNKQTQLSEVSRTISSILLAHGSPILDFILYIPRDLPLHQCLDMTSWIRYISNNGVRKLKIFNQSPSVYKIPSYLFSCLTLTRLRLTNCVIKPPLNFRGFCNLTSVKLVEVRIATDMSFGTRLEELDMEYCTGIEHLKRQFVYINNLTLLFISDCGGIDWQWFEYTKTIDSCLLLEGASEKLMRLDKLVKNMPRINSLYLDDIFFKILIPRPDVMKRLTTMRNLEYLNLYSVDFYDLVQIQYVLLLILRSPDLRILDINLAHEVLNSDDMDFLDPMVLSEGLILDQLETFILHEMVGSRAEFQFIKLMLASSPSLRRIELKMATIVNKSTEKLRILQEVLLIPRASKTAQIEIVA